MTASPSTSETVPGVHNKVSSTVAGFGVILTELNTGFELPIVMESKAVGPLPYKSRGVTSTRQISPRATAETGSVALTKLVVEPFLTHT